MNSMDSHPDIALREIFHLLFLEQLMRISDPRIYVLKGGVNLRFFFNSPRYSEDVDLDIISGNPATLKKNCYKILQDKSLLRSLSTYGVREIIINDPSKAKQTDTTQRFKLRLVTKQNIELPTKIEFSRRGITGKYVEALISSEVSRRYKRLSFRLQHYCDESPVIQKIEALAGRAETQARDIFDLYILLLGGFWIENLGQLESKTLDKAKINLFSVSYEQYRDQVEEYLSEEAKSNFSGENNWADIKSTILERF
jgi:predicted nucleotidyltransferase component of viral defense system